MPYGVTRSQLVKICNYEMRNFNSQYLVKIINRYKRVLYQKVTCEYLPRVITICYIIGKRIANHFAIIISITSEFDIDFLGHLSNWMSSGESPLVHHPGFLFQSSVTVSVILNFNMSHWTGSIALWLVRKHFLKFHLSRVSGQFSMSSLVHEHMNIKKICMGEAWYKWISFSYTTGHPYDPE